MPWTVARRTPPSIRGWFYSVPTGTATLLTLTRRSSDEERPHHALGLVGLESARETLDAAIDRRGRCKRFPFLNERLLQSDCLGSAGENGVERCRQGGIELVLGDAPFDEPPALGSRRVDHLPREQQPARPAPADELRQQRGLDHRGNPDLDLRHAEFGTYPGDAQIAGGRDLEPCAQRVPLDARDHRDGQTPQAIAGFVEGRDEGAGTRRVK